MRHKTEQAPHPMPCKKCGHGTRRVVDGRRECWLCKAK